MWFNSKCVNTSNEICNINNISREERTKLFKEIDEVMKSQFLKLNPNFSEETLSNMMNTYKGGYIIYPMDILIVEDAVFHKEGIMDDFGSIYKIKTSMYEGMRPYYNILALEFILSDFDILSLQTEEKKYISKFISDNINSTYQKNITIPKYILNSEGVSYGYSGLVNEVDGDIGRNIKAKKECDIKICIQNKDDITLYHVHQFFKNNEPIWRVVKTNNEVWKLTDEALKIENKYSNNTCKLIKINCHKFNGFVNLETYLYFILKKHNISRTFLEMLITWITLMVKINSIRIEQL